MNRHATELGLVAALFAGAPSDVLAQPEVPACRLATADAKQVERTLGLALKGFQELGQPLPFDSVAVNPTSAPTTPRTLVAYVVSDATTSAVDGNGCVVKQPAVVRDEELDERSVRGGCVAAVTGGVIRCSADAVAIFGGTPDAASKLNPALLYVLSHELGHIAQGRPGEYAGRLQTINLAASRSEKLQVLQDACEPGLTKVEEDADAQAVRLLSIQLPKPPFREPTFSQRGSVLWGIDQLNLSANTWTSRALAREYSSQPTPHKAFVPTEFPTPDAKVKANAKRFVCEVLTRKTGTVSFPGRSGTHPTLEVRIQRVVEALRPLAASLPAIDGSREYQPVATLQNQLSEIFTFMYRENGKYLQAVQSSICTRVNSDKPTQGC
ncbi:MAG: hypothetical protein EKK45_06890 [Curvibacter sp.]|nr:MAG: hypothetical protein EKK45_06890 [Curvibacter sp.]